MNEAGPNEQPEEGSVPIIGNEEEGDDAPESVPELKPKKKKSPAASVSTAKSKKDQIVEIPPGKTVFFDLNYNVAAALCYFPFLPIVPSAVWLKTETNGPNDYLRWHCIQGILFGGGFIALSVLIGTIEAIIGWIPFVGPIIALIFTLLRALIAVLFIVTCVKQMMAVYNRKPGRLPLISQYVDQYIQSGKV